MANSWPMTYFTGKTWPMMYLPIRNHKRSMYCLPNVQCLPNGKKKKITNIFSVCQFASYLTRVSSEKGKLSYLTSYNNIWRIRFLPLLRIVLILLRVFLSFLRFRLTYIRVAAFHTRWNWKFSLSVGHKRCPDQLLKPIFQNTCEIGQANRFKRTPLNKQSQIQEWTDHQYQLLESLLSHWKLKVT